MIEGIIKRNKKTVFQTKDGFISFGIGGF